MSGKIIGNANEYFLFVAVILAINAMQMLLTGSHFQWDDVRRSMQGRSTRQVYRNSVLLDPRRFGTYSGTRLLLPNNWVSLSTLRKCMHKTRHVHKKKKDEF